MQAVVVGVEADGGGVAGADREGGLAFDGVGEPEDLGEGDAAVGGVDVAEHSPGAGGGALPVVADEQDASAAVEDVAGGGVELGGGGEAGFVDDDQGGGSDAR